MSTAASFKNIGKGADDALGKGFCFDRKLVTKHKTDAGVTFNTEFKATGDKVSSKAGASFSVGEYLNVKKLEVNSKSRVASELVLSGLVPHASFTLESEVGPFSTTFADAGVVKVDYSSELATVDVSVDVVNSSVAASAVVAFAGVELGASAKYDTFPDKEDVAAAVSDYNVALGYSAGSFDLAAKTSDKLSKVGLSVIHKHSSDLTWAVVAKMDRADSSVSLTAGTIYKIDDDASVRAKIDSTGVVSAAYSQSLRAGVKLAISASVDGTKIDSDANHKLGFELTMGDN